MSKLLCQTSTVWFEMQLPKCRRPGGLPAGWRGMQLSPQMKSFPSSHMPSGRRPSHSNEVAGDHLDQLASSVEHPHAVVLRVWVQ
jgi:hypothetical protein